MSQYFANRVSDLKNPPEFDWWSKIQTKKRKNLGASENYKEDKNTIEENKTVTESNKITTINNTELESTKTSEEKLDGNPPSNYLTIPQSKLQNFYKNTSHPTPLIQEIINFHHIQHHKNIHEAQNLLKKGNSKIQRKLNPYTFSVLLKTKKLFSFLKNGLVLKKYGLAVFECDKKTVNFFEKKKILLWSGEVEKFWNGVKICNSDFDGELGIYKSLIEYEIFKVDKETI